MFSEASAHKNRPIDQVSLIFSAQSDVSDLDLADHPEGHGGQRLLAPLALIKAGSARSMMKI
jgi:hypothetical protein